MADFIMAAAPSGDLPVQAVRLKMAKRPRKVRQPDPNTHRPLQCPHPGCGKWFKGPRLLDRHFRGHEGLADGECLKCGREFNFVTALRYHCKHRCGPESLPKRHIPQKGKEALEWAALLAPAAELEQLLDGEEEGQQQQNIVQQLLCEEQMEQTQEEEEQQQQQLPPPPRAPPAAD